MDKVLVVEGGCRIEKIARIDLVGDIAAKHDLSGVVLVDDWLVLVSDEGHGLQLLRRCGEVRWEVHSSIELAASKDESDLEAVAFADGFLYALGSHSRRRRTLKPDRKVARNLKRFTRVDRQRSRERLYRIPFDRRDGRFGKPAFISLAKRLRKDPILGPFAKIPGKENGVDIEGMALDNAHLYLGFRGPVLHPNLVPVWRLTFEHPKRYRQLFVDLGGQGIRDMLKVDGGCLILSGPVSDRRGGFKLWLWDGRDQMPGKGLYPQPTRLLGEITPPPGGKPEGMALLAQKPGSVDLLIVFDSLAGGGCSQYRIEL